VTRAPAGLVALLLGIAVMPAPARRLTAQISPGPLAQPHAALEGVRNCVGCHGTKKEEMPARCLQCHRDVAWLVDRGRGYHASVTGQRCAACHPDHAGSDFQLISWPGRDSSAFDHSRTGWPLAGKHAGVSCDACHRMTFRVSPAAALSQRKTTPGWMGLERDCAGCHGDPHRGTLGAGCADCHDVDGWRPAAGFDHDSTGYPLTGKHRTVACADCHAGAPVSAGRAGAPVVPAVFSPLPHADCAACHRDPHGGRLGSTCSRCHTTAGFSSFATATFDHEHTRYPLRGAHLSVRCDQCHDFRPAAAHRDRPFATCGACHTDPHAGRATLAGQAADCAYCHTVAGFTPATYTVARHATTRFPLLGRHQTVSCGSCHVRDHDPAKRAALGTAAVQMRPSTACVDCHQDPHQGRVAALGDCASCHALTGFRPSTVDVAAHARYRFILTGAHRATPCAACHRDLTRPGVRPLLFGAAGTSCRDCHQDPHGGQFADSTGGRAAATCDHCHVTDGFRPAPLFDHDRDTRFPLTGGHTGVSCERCHRVAPGTAGRGVTRYRGTATACEACHTGTPRRGR